MLQRGHTRIRTVDVKPLERVVPEDAPRFVGSSGVLLWAARAGRPVLAQEFGLIGRLTRDHRLGTVAHSSGPVRLADEIERMVVRATNLHRPVVDHDVRIVADAETLRIDGALQRDRRRRLDQDLPGGIRPKNSSQSDVATAPDDTTPARRRSLTIRRSQAVMGASTHLKMIRDVTVLRIRLDETITMPSAGPVIPDLAAATPITGNTKPCVRYIE